ncbi:hypothetical protein [Streptomyces sp. NRRL S-813]|uniref:hypothetical protein n=1 Tax=Streptomyces sp. NRRL S-813 TaxID=1463919 RepID=UPI0004C0F996|nr:hypothetical protein [Streptomyces sp. NRRL S-813]
MPTSLDNGHTWDVHQTYGQLPNNPTEYQAPGKTWLAVIRDTTTGRPLIKSQLHTTREQAIADAERQYTAR